MMHAMIRTVAPRRRRAAWAAVAGTLVVMACGGGPDAAPVPPDPPPPDLAPSTDESESAAPVTVAPAPQPPPEPPPPPTEPAEPPEFDVDAGGVWGDVFDSFTAAERSCIRSALGDDLLDEVLEWPLTSDADTPEWEASIFDCLAPATARSLVLAVMVQGLRDEMDVEELRAEQVSCLRDQLEDLDIAALVAAKHADVYDPGFAQVTAVLVACVPDLFLAEMLVDLGVDMAGLSPEELSCLRGWLSELDWDGLAAPADDPAALESLEAMMFGLLACLPEAFGSPEPQATGPDDHGDSSEEATAVTVGEPVDGGMDHLNDVDFFTFEALAGESYELEVTLDSLEDSVMALHDAEGRQVAFNDDRDQDSFGSLISWVAPASGSYYVEVAGFDPFATGSYTLSVTAG